VEEFGPCPVFASFTLAFALQLREKHGKTSFTVRKTSVRLRKTSDRVQYTFYQKTHTLQNPHKHTQLQNPPQTHTLQNKIKPPQYKLKQNASKKSNTMGRKNCTWFIMLLI
jgi:surface antigen